MTDISYGSMQCGVESTVNTRLSVNEKFFIDKGALFGAMSKYSSLFYIIQFAVRRKKLYSKEISFFNALKYMIQGRRKFYEY